MATRTAARFIWLFRQSMTSFGVRLTGIAVTHLGEGPPPPMLFPDVARVGRARVEGVIAAVEGRFGVELTRATLLEPGSRRPRR